MDYNDFYELTYRNYKSHGKHQYNYEKYIDEIDSISDEIKYAVNKQLISLKNTEPVKHDEINFSDVLYTETAMLDENKKLIFNYTPVFADEVKNINPNEYITRFNKLDINNLPLIDVANFLGIKVEKSLNIKPYGRYILNEKKIVLGSDYIPTFIHELVHAIIHIIDEIYPSFNLYDTDYNEFIAEYSALILCKKYNINVNTPYSMYYIRMYYEDIDNDIPDFLINRVEIICEVVKKCKEIINKRG